MIPTRELTHRDLVRRLRDLVDKVSDPEYRLRQPQQFAEDYHVMITIAQDNYIKLNSPYATHNLGKWRREYIEKCLTE